MTDADDVQSHLDFLADYVCPFCGDRLTALLRNEAAPRSLHSFTIPGLSELEHRHYLRCSQEKGRLDDYRNSLNTERWPASTSITTFWVQAERYWHHGYEQAWRSRMMRIRKKKG